MNKVASNSRTREKSKTFHFFFIVLSWLQEVEVGMRMENVPRFKIYGRNGEASCRNDDASSRIIKDRLYKRVE